jgi:hypothetical protein
MVRTNEGSGNSNMMRSLICLFAAGLFGVFLGACGGSSKDESPAHRVSSDPARGTLLAGASTNESSSSHLKGDEDDDDSVGNYTNKGSRDSDADFDNDSKANENKSYRDRDDASVSGYGRSANAAESRMIGETVERYYAASQAEDGVAGCALMYSAWANNVPVDYGSGAGPQYSRGNTCAVVMTKLFKHFHSTLTAAIVVTGVRVKGDMALALIGSKTAPASYFTLKRERGAWKIDCLLAAQLP